jgi:hypothetical protein
MACPGVDKGGNVRNLGYVSTETIGNLKDFMFKGPFRDQGMPDFTGKLTEADMVKNPGFHPGHCGRHTFEAAHPVPARCSVFSRCAARRAVAPSIWYIATIDLFPIGNRIRVALLDRDVQ